MAAPAPDGLAAVMAILSDGRPRTTLQLQAQLLQETGRLYRLASLGRLVRRLRGQADLQTVPVYRRPREVAYRIGRTTTRDQETGG